MENTKYQSTSSPAPPQQAPIPQAPASQAPAPQVPTPQASAPQVPTPQVPAPQAPTPQAPTPQAPTPQAPTPPPQAQPTIVQILQAPPLQQAQALPTHAPPTQVLPPAVQPPHAPSPLVQPPPFVKDYRPTWDGNLHYGFTSTSSVAPPSSHSDLPPTSLPKLDLSIFKSQHAARARAAEKAGIVTKISKPAASPNLVRAVGPAITENVSTTQGGQPIARTLGHSGTTAKSELAFGTHSLAQFLSAEPLTNYAPGSFNQQSKQLSVVSAEQKGDVNQPSENSQRTVSSPYALKSESSTITEKLKPARDNHEALSREYSINDSAAIAHLEPADRQKVSQIVSQLQQHVSPAAATTPPPPLDAMHRPAATTSITLLPHVSGVTSGVGMLPGTSPLGPAGLYSYEQVAAAGAWGFVDYSNRLLSPSASSGAVVATPIPFSPVKDLQQLLKNQPLEARLQEDYQQRLQETKSQSELYARKEQEKTILPPAKSIFSSEHSVLPPARNIFTHVSKTLDHIAQPAYQPATANPHNITQSDAAVVYLPVPPSYTQDSSKVVYSQSPSPSKIVYLPPPSKSLFSPESTKATSSQPILSNLKPSVPPEVSVTVYQQDNSKADGAQYPSSMANDASRNLQELAMVVQLHESSKRAYDPKLLYSQEAPKNTSSLVVSTNTPAQATPQHVYSKAEAANLCTQEMTRGFVQDDARHFADSRLTYAQGKGSYTPQDKTMVYTEKQSYAGQQSRVSVQHVSSGHGSALHSVEEQALSRMNDQPQLYEPQQQPYDQNFNPPPSEQAPVQAVDQEPDSINRPQVMKPRKRKYVRKEPKPKKSGPQYHKQKLNKDSPYKCVICDKGFQKERGLQDHMWHYHSDFRPVKCEVCNERFCSKDRLLDHMRQHNPKSFICTKCGKGFKTNGHLKQHLKIHSKLPSYPCDQCDRVFEKEGFLRQHYLKHKDNRPNQCGLCKKVYKNQQYLNVHFLKCHSDHKFWKCRECSDLYIKEEQLDEHMKSHEEARGKNKQMNTKLSEKELFKIMQKGKVKILQQKVIKAKEAQKQANNIGSSSAQSEGNMSATLKSAPDTLNSQPEKTDTSAGDLKQAGREAEVDRLTSEPDATEGEDLPFPCVLCEKSFTMRQEIINHIFRVHSTAPDGSTQCFICKVTFKGSKRFQKHMIRHVDSSKYTCRICGMTCSTKTTFALHSQQQHGMEKAFKCQECNKAYFTESSLKEHTKQHVPRPFKCPLCEDNFRKEWKYIEHMQQDHDIERPFACQLCGKSYLKAKALEKHITVTHPNGEKPPKKKRKTSYGPGFTSPVKSESSNEAADFQEHSKEKRVVRGNAQTVGIDEDSDSETETSECLEETPVKKEGRRERKQQDINMNSSVENNSNDAFSNNDEATMNTSAELASPVPELHTVSLSQSTVMRASSITPSSTRSVNQCTMCEEMFASRAELMAHVTQTYFKRTGTSNRDFQCEICLATFRRSASLRDHLLHNHSAVRPFSCPHCDATFASKQRQYDHLRQHQSKQSVCEICGKAFRSRSHLKAHKATHEKAEKYQCDVCGRSFKKEGFLKQHALKHGEKRPNQCGVCKKVFKNQEYLNNHLRKEHPGERFFQCDRCVDIFLDEADFKDHKMKHEKDDRNAVMHEQANKKLPEEEIMKLVEKAVGEESQKEVADNSNVTSQDIAKTAEGMIDAMERDRLTAQPTPSKGPKRRRVMDQTEPGETTSESVKSPLDASANQKHVTKPRLLPCSECGKFFTKLADLRAHTRENHQLESNAKDQEEKDSLKCAECSKAFRNKRSLDMHVKNCVKVSTSQFKCTTCGKQCESKLALKKHAMETHKRGRKPRGASAQKKNYGCVVCGKSFETSDELTTHTCEPNVESFRCPICNVGFHARRALDDHMFTHSGQRPVGCTVCGQNFSRLRDMKEHQRTMHGPQASSKDAERVDKN